MSELQELLNQCCQPVNPQDKKMVIPTIESYLNMLAGWDVSLDYSTISKTFNFKNYHQTIAFVNAVTWIAHKEDHHPEICFGYNSCRITLITKAIKGISLNDMIVAAKINQLLA